MFLRQRSTDDEIMDEAEQDEAAFDTALTNLAWLTRVTRGAGPTLRYLDRVVAAHGVTHLRILDVGAGGGDMLRSIAAWGARRGITLELTGLDIAPAAKRHAMAAGTPARWITCDLFDLPEHETFDIVLSALFAHHLRDPALVRFLRWLDGRSRLGWMISDIHRHWVAWAGVWALVRVARMDPMVIHDSTVSIARGFVREDWDRLLAEAGLQAEVRWHIPFRWVVGTLRQP